MIYSFPPIERRDAKLLILGSMPGVRSLEERRYYAHPRNAFWRVVETLFADGGTLDFDRRYDLLRENRIALWDVLQSCRREGSSDTDIREADPNDFGAFFAEHPDIGVVFFNGKAAESLFLKLVLKAAETVTPEFYVLPSTSPANTMPFSEKLDKWKKIREFI